MSLRTSEATTTLGVSDLSREDYKDFCWHSVCVVDQPGNTLAAVRYFLPRVAADLSRTEDEFSFDNVPPWDDALLASLLNEVRWRQWPQREVAAVEGWLEAWLDKEAQDLRDTRVSKFSQVFCIAAICGYDVGGYLRRRERDGILVVARLLAVLIDDHWEALLSTGWPADWRGYWGDATPPAAATRQFVHLLVSPKTRGILERAFFETHDESLRSLLSDAQLHASQCIEFGHLRADTPLAEETRRLGQAEREKR